MVRLLHRIGLSEVLNVDPRGFYQLDAMQGNGSRQNRLEFIPDPNDQVFNGAHFTPHEVHIQVQVTVIQFLDHTVFNDPAQQFGIHNESGVRIRITLYRHEQFKIVPVPILIRTSAKHFIVLLLAPGRIEQFVGRIKMLYSC